MQTKLKLKLVVQGSRSIAQGEVPVIALQYQDGNNPGERIAETIGFLRSGCPSVSWIINLGEIGKGNEGSWEVFSCRLAQIMNDLSLEGELIGLHWPRNYRDKEDFIVTFERRLEKKAPEAEIGKVGSPLG